LDYAVYVPVGPVTPWACTTAKIADVPNCAWTTDPKPIDTVTATYLLNQENKHTERLYDNVTEYELIIFLSLVLDSLILVQTHHGTMLIMLMEIMR
jgi:hypothetical protein